MNYFLSQSIELANSRNYLDELFRVYHISPDCLREIDTQKWANFETQFNQNNQDKMFETLIAHKDKNIFSALLLRDFLYQV